MSGTGMLPMSELKAMGEACGFGRVRTWIASGNLLFDSELDEGQIVERLEKAGYKVDRATYANWTFFAPILAGHGFNVQIADTRDVYRDADHAAGQSAPRTFRVT